MAEMFKFLTGILEKEEQKAWKILAFFYAISPVLDLMNFSVIIYIMNIVAREKQASAEIIIFTVFMGILVLLKGFLDLYRCRLSNRFVYGGAQKLSLKLFELQMKETLTEHNRKSAMQALAVVRDDTQKCIDIILNCLEVWIHSFAMAGFFVMLIYTSKWVGVISCILFSIFMAVIFFVFRREIQFYGKKSRKYAIKANAQITIAYGIFKELKTVNRSDTILDKYRDASQSYALMQEEFRYKTSIISMFMQNLVMSGTFIALAFIWLCSSENLAFIVASAAVYIMILMKMIPLAYGIVSSLNQIEFSKKSYEIIRTSMERYAGIKEEEYQKRENRQKELTFQRGISVRNLTFGYEKRKKIFLNASMEIPAGCSVAIIGASGSGKTTLLDLILGLLDPQTGTIMYDDYDLAVREDEEGMCTANLGDIVSYIPQIVYMNGETIRNNVAFFARENEIDNDKVIACLKCAQIWKDVEQMPEGIHTLIGENGVTISEGQRQRIALARALYRDFEILIMDEATGSLDEETEKAVIDSIWQIKRNKTLLMVTHHINLANECDRIYKIEDQKIIRVK